jgi:hypothetical protein
MIRGYGLGGGGREVELNFERVEGLLASMLSRDREGRGRGLEVENMRFHKRMQGR